VHLSPKPSLCDSISVRQAILILAAALVAACTSGAEQRQESRATSWRPVASWSGHGNTTLETFPIGAGRLRIYWDIRNESPAGAGRFHVKLHSADSGRVLDEVADVKGNGADLKEIVDDHQRFYLSVESANVDWTLRVEEGLAARR
jgi:hypothetical protein